MGQNCQIIIGQMVKSLCQISVGQNSKIHMVKNCQIDMGQNCQNEMGQNCQIKPGKNVTMSWVKSKYVKLLWVTVRIVLKQIKM